MNTEDTYTSGWLYAITNFPSQQNEKRLQW